MTTAVALNAVSSIISGQGLAQSPALVTTISTYQSNPALASFANAYVNAGISSSVTANIVTQLNTVGANITSGHFLLDLYPGNATLSSSATITPWAANLNLPAGSFFSANSKVYTVTGNIFSQSFDGNVLTNSKIVGFSTVLLKQASLPFSSGLSGFANVFQNAYSYAQQVFDTVSSVSMLQNKTYKDSGIGYTGPTDLVTGGIGTHGSLLANVVANWGTMYDINNITKMHDPYVFGQHLLNQGLGYVNGLADQLTAVGLDITNLPKVPAVNTTTTQEDSSVTVSSFIGEVELPTVVEVTTSTPVAGSSPAVVLNIYKTVTGSNLQAIVNATAITNSTATTLDEYLDLSKVVSSSNLTELNSLGITTFESFSTYLGKKVGQGRFKSWADLSTFLKSLETPTLTHLPTGANTNALYSSTVTTLNSTYGVGSGQLGNPVMIDYLGATAGDPYTLRFANINANYGGLSSSVNTAAHNLDQAVINYCNQYNTYLASAVPDSAVPPAPPNNDAVPPDPALLPPWSWITSNVAALNSALSSIPSNSLVSYLNWEWYNMIDRLSKEVANLSRAHVTFGPGTAMQLLGFAETIGQLASNKTEVETYQFFANIITNDLAGDTIRAAVAETINTKLLNQIGIATYNDPDPRLKTYQSQTQNIPLSTYITRNK